MKTTKLIITILLFFLIKFIPKLNSQTNANPTFKWLNPSNANGNDYVAMSFLNSNEGTAISRTHFYHTQNGGTTWNMNNISDSLSCYKVVMVSSDTAYILARSPYYNLIFLKTVDRGLNWTVKHKFSSTKTVGSVLANSFFEGNIVYTFSTQSNVNYMHKSIDGGNTWVNNILNFGPGNNIYYPYFINSNEGFLIVKNAFSLISNIYKTINAGATWSQVTNTPVSFAYNSKILFFNSNDGFILTPSSTLIKTIDGGMTWNTVSSNFNFSTLKGSVFSGTKLNELIVSAGNSSSEKIIATSSDAGITWTTNTLSNNILSIALAGNAFVIGCEFGDIYKSTNITNWTSQVNYITQKNISGMDFINKNIGYIGTSNGEIFKTTDGGNNWLLIHNVGSSILDLNLCDNLHGIITTNNSIYTTSDGGNSWSVSKTAPANSYFISSSCGSSYYYSLLSSYSNYSSTVYKSTNFGSTWTQVFSGSYYDIYSKLYFYDNNLGYGIGNGKLYRTGNAGATWQQSTSYVFGTSLRDICMVDNNIGYLLVEPGNSSDPRILQKTTDGGLNWATVHTFSFSPNSNSKGLIEVQFASPDTGFVLNNNTDILYTTNGGMTFSKIFSIQSNSWPFNNSTVFPEKNIGYFTYGRHLLKCNLNQLTTEIVNNTELFNDIIIYPNPNCGIFILDNIENSFITITNILGETILTKKTSTTKESIDLSNETNGIYFVKIISNNQQYTKRLVINK